MSKSLRFVLGGWLVVIAWFFIDSHGRHDDATDEVQELIKSEVGMADVVLRELMDQFAEVTNPTDLTTDYRFPVVIYDNGRMVYWSSNAYIPDYLKYRSSDSLSLYSDTGGSRLILRKNIRYQHGLLEFYALIPIYQQYPVENSRMQSGYNPLLFDGYVIEPSLDEVKVSDRVSLNIQAKYNRDSSVETITIFVLIVVLTLISIKLIFNYLGGSPIRNLVMTLVIAGGWTVLVINYAGSNLNSSFRHIDSDYFVHVEFLLLTLVVVLTLVHRAVQIAMHNRMIARLRHERPIVLLTISSLVGYAAAFWLFQSTWWILLSFPTSLDITQSIQFDLIRISAFLAVLLVGSIYFFINHLCLRLVANTDANLKSKLLVMTLSSGVVLLLPIPFNEYVAAIVPVTWVIVYLTGSSVQLTNLKYGTLFYLIVISIQVSVVTAICIYEQFEASERENKEHYVSQVLSGNDLLGEHYFEQLISSINSDPFIHSRFQNEMLARLNMEDQILQYKANYLSKYNMQIHMYDTLGVPFGVYGDLSLDYWNRHLNQLNQTSKESLFFIQDDRSGRHKYVCRLNVERNNQRFGTLILEFTLKKYHSKTVFPSLLVEESSQGSSKTYDYAFYQGGRLQYRSGTFEFEDVISQEELQQLSQRRYGEEEGQYHYLARQLEDDRIMMVVSKVYAYRDILGNISFMFIVTLICISIVFAIISAVSPIRSFSLANRIQLYMGIAFILPVLAISIAILNALNISYKDEINRSYQKRARNVAENVVQEIQDFLENDINRNQFTDQLVDMADLVQADLIVYSTRGKVLSTNRPEVFNLNLLSRQVNPLAAKHIIREQGQLVVADEQIGSLKFRTVYTGIYGYDSGELLGVLAMPFFDSKNHLSRQQVEVFNNIITLFSIIFLISLVVGNFGLKNLIAPIKVVANRMRKTNYLEADTTPLSYSHNDEIGLLVYEYNRMLSKLGESREELARIQKDTAWKEIARQVAHEIKNPLTPMKLKIQQMQRQLEPEDLSYQNLNGLLAQIETLASIADSFSAFAQMPAPNNQETDFSSLVRSTASLFQTDDQHVTLDIEEKLQAYVDPKLMAQIINNLMLNAIQSVIEKKPELEVTLARDSGKLKLSISDNGQGVPVELKDKIFKPYFSTKEKGSGIGLALAKKGIEQAGGSIWYEENAGGGTTFYITLPPLEHTYYKS